MFLKLVHTYQGYQSHQLWSDLDCYRRRHWSIFKTAALLSLKEFSFHEQNWKLVNIPF